MAAIRLNESRCAFVADCLACDSCWCSLRVCSRGLVGRSLLTRGETQLLRDPLHGFQYQSDVLPEFHS